MNIQKALSHRQLTGLRDVTGVYRSDVCRSKAYRPGLNLSRSCLILFLAIYMFAAVSTNTAYAEEVLILYDSSGPYGHIGLSHGMMLENLLGHFEVDVVKKPVSAYTSGDMDSRVATFYIGSVYDEQSNYARNSAQWQNYNSFIADAADATAPLAWFNYNLWLLSDFLQHRGTSLSDAFGFTFNNVWNQGYNRVTYKNTKLFKGVVPFPNPGSNLQGCIEEGDGRWACSTELNAVNIVDAAAATVYASAYSTITADVDETPYITRSENFWFIGDLPFNHISEEDRYLALADVLHDILGIEHATSHKALVRLEDVSANTKKSDLNSIATYFKRESVPFAVATIPFYMDGTGKVQRLSRSKTGRYLSKLYRTSRSKQKNRPMVSIIAHGATHQSDYPKNPYNGISGDDFEFYRVTINNDNSLNFLGPLPWDVKTWPLNRMKKARRELRRSGLRAFAWEAPHYIASANTYSKVRAIYPIHYGRITYFIDEDRMLGQFFPYPISRDSYGYRVVPENIGYFEPDPFAGYRPLYPEDLIRHAKKNLVIRDGYASFFYHPPLGVENLKVIVAGLKSLGYEFVAANSIFRK